MELHVFWRLSRHCDCCDKETIVLQIDPGHGKQQDKELLEKEKGNLSHQQDNLLMEESLIESAQTAETPAEAHKLRQEAHMLEIVEKKLEIEQQTILEEEAEVEGWDFETAKAAAEELESNAGEDAPVDGREAEDNNED